MKIKIRRILDRVNLRRREVYWIGVVVAMAWPRRVDEGLAMVVVGCGRAAEVLLQDFLPALRARYLGT